MFNITNYFDHPTRIGYTVFKFYEKQRADYFESLLKKDGIWFESSREEDPSIFIYGIKKADHKEAMNANYLVNAKFRNKIIPNVYFRWIVIVLSIIIITIAIIGAIVKT